MNQSDTNPAPTMLPDQKPVGSSKKPRRSYQTHGHSTHTRRAWPLHKNLTLEEAWGGGATPQWPQLRPRQARGETFSRYMRPTHHGGVRCDHIGSSPSCSSCPSLPRLKTLAM